MVGAVGFRIGPSPTGAGGDGFVVVVDVGATGDFGGVTAGRIGVTFCGIGAGRTGCEGFGAGMLFADTIGGGGGGGGVLNANGRGESRFDVGCWNSFFGSGGESCCWRDEAGGVLTGTFGFRKIGGTMCSEGERMFSATVFSTNAFSSSSESLGFFDPERPEPPVDSFALRLPCCEGLPAVFGEVVGVGGGGGEDFFTGGTTLATGTGVLGASSGGEALPEPAGVLIGASSNELRNCDFSSVNFFTGGGGVGGEGGSGGDGEDVRLVLSTLRGKPNLSVDVAMSGLR